MVLFNWIAGSLLATISLAVAYLYLQAILGALSKKRYPAPPAKCNTLVLIPAYNEAEKIGDCLSSLQTVKPLGALETVVIADNCTDATADVARGMGFRIIERSAPRSPGKGEALLWAFRQLDISGFECVMVVDADTTVEPNMVEAVAASLASGAGAVQLHNELTIADDTPLAQLQHIANAAENHLFWHGRSAAGLPVLLRGTGMAIATETLRRYPWNSTSITEDTEYSMYLLREGVKIDYCMISSARSAATSSYDQCLAQKHRWFFGTLNCIKNSALPLVRTALRTFNPRLIELAATLFLLSRPTLGYVALLAMILAVFGTGGFPFVSLLWGSSLILLLIAYVLSGIFFVSNKTAALKGLLHIPRFTLWYMGMQIQGLFFGREDRWVPTERTVHHDAKRPY